MTLVELVVAMTSSALVFTLAIGTIEQAMKLSSHAKQQAAHQSALARLGQQLRTDVHQSLSIEKPNDSTQLALNQSDRTTIRYSFADATVTREASTTGSSKVIKEVYRLTAASIVRFELSHPERIEMVVLRNTPEGERLESRVVALSNRLSRLQPTPGGEP